MHMQKYILQILVLKFIEVDFNMKAVFILLWLFLF